MDHHCRPTDPPGTGKTRLARALPAILSRVALVEVPGKQPIALGGCRDLLGDDDSQSRGKGEPVMISAPQDA